MDLPLHSVCIPAYNHERYILSCLESIRAQTYPRLELTVINDGSRDRTAELRKLFSSVAAIVSSGSNWCEAEQGGLRRVTGCWNWSKGTSFKRLAEATLKRVVDKLNTRPRKCLCYRTPLEVFNETVGGALAT
ncbi:glycosyl transferase family 2 [Geothermobacter ehrlichii]|uniref:Glycosyl transferase family 2 n=2 Tax=Geothermobacter ehrlichii TaxID=213224 RepID=A0A5D3WLM7_9BACT|nr:glycosyl transferase family 2 [Geothermobacter ehrlichii]